MRWEGGKRRRRKWEEVGGGGGGGGRGGGGESGRRRRRFLCKPLIVCDGQETFQINIERFPSFLDSDGK